jgi:hypothetical protein
MYNQSLAAELTHDNAGDAELLYTQWLRTCEQLHAAYHRWCEAPPAYRDDCYIVMVAVSDQEAAAANAYASAVMSRPADPELEPAVVSLTAAVERA